VDITAHFAREAKLTAAKVAAVGNGSADPAFDAAEADALRIAEGMSATPAHIDEGAFARLRTAYGDPAMVELAAAVAAENFSARFNHAFDIPPAGFAEGAACALPPRKNP